MLTIIQEPKVELAKKARKQHKKPKQQQPDAPVIVAKEPLMNPEFEFHEDEAREEMWIPHDQLRDDDYVCFIELID